MSPKDLLNVFVAENRPLPATALAVIEDGTLRIADELADLAVRHGNEEAAKIMSLIEACRNAAEPSQMIERAVAVFAEGLANRGAGKNVIASRKCDLRAILKAAAALGDLEFEARGLQGMAKEARAAMKPAKTDEGSAESVLPAETMSEDEKVAALADLLYRAKNMAKQFEWWEVEELIKTALNKVIN